MMECIDDCPFIKFEHGPLICLEDLHGVPEGSYVVNCTYIYSLDALVYLSCDGLRGIKLEEFLGERDEMSKADATCIKNAVKTSKTYTLSSINTHNFLDPVLQQYKFYHFALNHSESYAAFLVDHSYPSENNPQIVIAQLSRANRRFNFFKRINLYKSETDRALKNGIQVKNFRWSIYDELIIQDMEHCLYIISFLSDSLPPELNLILDNIRFPGQVSLFGTSFVRFSSLERQYECHPKVDPVARNVLIVVGKTADTLYVAYPQDFGRFLPESPPVIQKVDASLLGTKLIGILNTEDIPDLSKLYVTNVSPTSLTGFDWVITFFFVEKEMEDAEYAIDQDESFYPDLLHAFVRFSSNFASIEICHGMAFNEIQINLKKKKNLEYLPATPVVTASHISCFFLFSSCAPDIGIISSLKALQLSPDQALVAVKPPEAFQISCEQLDFEKNVGCWDIIYVERYPVSLIRSNVAMDASRLINPGLLLVIQTDGIVACHYIDCDVLTGSMEPDLNNIVEGRLELPISQNDSMDDQQKCFDSISSYVKIPDPQRMKLDEKKLSFEAQIISNSISVVKDPCSKTNNIVCNQAQCLLQSAESTSLERKNLEPASSVTTNEMIQQVFLAEGLGGTSTELCSVLARGLYAYEAEVTELEAGINEDISVNWTNIVDSSFQQSNNLSQQICCISKELNDMCKGVMSNLQQEFKSLVHDTGCTAEIRRILGLSLNTLNDLACGKGIRTSDFATDSDSYRHAIQDCLNFMSLMDHTGRIIDASLATIVENFQASKTFDQVNEKMLGCTHRTMSLLYSALALIDVMLSRINSFKRCVVDTINTARSHKSHFDSSARRYALDYNLLDSLTDSKAPKEFRTGASALSSDSVRSKQSLVYSDESSTQLIDSVHKRLRELQISIRQLKYQFSSIAFIHSRVVPNPTPIKDILSTLPYIHLPPLINHLFIEDRMCEKGNALLLFDFVEKGLGMSSRFLNLLTPNEGPSPERATMESSRIHYFNSLRESVVALKQRQQHLHERRNSSRTLLSQCFDDPKDKTAKVYDSTKLSQDILLSKDDMGLFGEKDLENEISLLKGISILSLKHSSPSPESAREQCKGEEHSNFSPVPTKGNQEEKQHSALDTGPVREQRKEKGHSGCKNDETINVVSPLSVRKPFDADGSMKEGLGDVNYDATGSSSVLERFDEQSNANREPVLSQSNDIMVTEALSCTRAENLAEIAHAENVSLKLKNEVYESETKQNEFQESPAKVDQEVSLESPLQADEDAAESQSMDGLNRSERSQSLFSTSVPAHQIFFSSSEKILQPASLVSTGANPSQFTAPDLMNQTSSSFFYPPSVSNTEFFENSAFERKQYTFGLDASAAPAQSVTPSMGVSQSSWGESLTKLAPQHEISISERARQLTTACNGFGTLSSCEGMNQSQGTPVNVAFPLATDTPPFQSCLSYGQSSMMPAAVSSAPLGGSGASGPFGSISSGFGKIPQNSAPSTSGATPFSFGNLFNGPTAVNVGNYRIPDTLN